MKENEIAEAIRECLTTNDGKNLADAIFSAGFNLGRIADALEYLGHATKGTGAIESISNGLSEVAAAIQLVADNGREER